MECVKGVLREYFKTGSCQKTFLSYAYKVQHSTVQVIGVYDATFHMVNEDEGRCVVMTGIGGGSKTGRKNETGYKNERSILETRRDASGTDMGVDYCTVLYCTVMYYNAPNGTKIQGYGTEMRTRFKNRQERGG